MRELALALKADLVPVPPNGPFWRQLRVVRRAAGGTRPSSMGQAQLHGWRDRSRLSYQASMVASPNSTQLR